MASNRLSMHIFLVNVGMRPGSGYPGNETVANINTVWFWGYLMMVCMPSFKACTQEWGRKGSTSATAHALRNRL